MSLQKLVTKVRNDCWMVLEQRRITQQEFSEKHGLSYSWLNKFLKDKGTDYRVGSVEGLRVAIQKERGAS